MSAPDRATLLARVELVRDRIAGAGGDPERVTLLAVTKGFGPEVALAAAEAGLVDLGENYAQELLELADLTEGGEPPAHPMLHL